MCHKTGVEVQDEISSVEINEQLKISTNIELQTPGQPPVMGPQLFCDSYLQNNYVFHSGTYNQ